MHLFLKKKKKEKLKYIDWEIIVNPNLVTTSGCHKIM